MDKKALKSVLGVNLVAQGFKNKASSWYRQTEGALQLVDLQKSAYGLQFYLNLCCVPAGMNVEGVPVPKEHQCPVRIRLTAAFPDKRSEIEEVFDLERTGIDDVAREIRIAQLTSELVLPFLEHMKDKVALKLAIQQGMFNRGMVDLAVQKHLGIVV